MAANNGFRWSSLAPNLSGTLLGSAITFWYNDRKREQDLKIETSKTISRLLEAQPKVGESMESILSFWREHNNEISSATGVNAVAEKWASSKSTTPEVNKARLTLNQYYLTLFLFHNIGLLPGSMITVFPGKYRAAMYFNNVCPLEKANTKFYLGRDPPDEALPVCTWLQKEFKFTHYRPLETPLE